MITISVWPSFEWKTLTLRWHARCFDPALTPAVAIRKAASSLDQEYLAVKVSQGEYALHFRRSWFNARRVLTGGRSGSWLGWLLKGQVAVTGGDGQVTVMASGSLALLLVLPILICALVYLKYRSATLVVAGVMLIVMAIAYVATSDALQNVDDGRSET